ncbi:zeta toxin family protein [Cytophagaceae bacterium ABcell3]|nr:zeta toxin family protein [Cytophagaceae bacterium ABcell3]
MKPKLILIAGPNGAGKSFNAPDIVPELDHFDFDELKQAFYKADKDHEFREQFAHAKAQKAFEAAKENALNKKDSFAYETNFFTETCMDTPRRFKNAGYDIDLYFVYLQDVEISKERVNIRVKLGGHYVPAEEIEHRFKNGLCNVKNSYSEFDNFYLIDGETSKAVLCCQKGQLVESPEILPDFVKNNFDLSDPVS